MGVLQPDVGYRRRNGESRLSLNGRAITVISLTQAAAATEAAAALGVPVTLLSAPHAAANVGVAWFASVVEKAGARHPAVAITAVLDCGAAPGHALAAIRHGVGMLRYDGPAENVIREIASKAGTRVIAKRPESLDLQFVVSAGEDPVAACHAWLRDSA